MESLYKSHYYYPNRWLHAVDRLVANRGVRQQCITSIHFYNGLAVIGSCCSMQCLFWVRPALLFVHSLHITCA